MNDTPLVSVVLPVRNGAATLDAALDSLQSQTLKDFEIVAVDDGSTDATGEILRRRAGQDHRLRPLHLPPRGLVEALNAGVAHSRGRYIARMDADDISLPQRLQAQSEVLSADPGLGLVSCLVAFGGDSVACAGYALHVEWLNSLTAPEDIWLNRFVESPLAHPSVMFRRELLESLGGYRDGPFPEDYELWLRMLAAGVRMAKLPQTLFVWNDPPDRLSRTHANYAAQAFDQLKAVYMAEHLRAQGVAAVWAWGAGQTSRRRADLLVRQGIVVEAYIDIDPRKQGNVVAGRRVVAPQALPPRGQCFVVGYVGSRGARELISARLEAAGYILGRDFIHAV